MEEPPSPDAWIGHLILQRYEHLGMTQADFSRKADLSDTIVREVERGELRKRRPKNLRSLSLALQWPPDALKRLLDGDRPEDIGIGVKQPPPHDESQTDEALNRRLTLVEAELAEVRRGVQEILRRLPPADAP